MSILQQLWRGAREPEPTGYRAPDETMSLWNDMQAALAKNPTPYDMSIVPMPMRRQVSPLPSAPTQTFEQAPQQVMGATSGYANPYADYVEGRDPIKELFLTDEEIETIRRNARERAGMVSSDPRLTYRQPEKVGENIEFVDQYLDSLLRMAPYYNLPPRTLAGIIMHESGFGGQRFGGNLGGFGFPGSGDVDLGYRFVPEGVDPEVFDPRMVVKFLEAMSNEATSHWQPENYRYRGARSPYEFVHGGEGFVGGYNDPVEGDPNWINHINTMIEVLNRQ